MTAVAEPVFTPLTPSAARGRLLGHFRRGKQFQDAGDFLAALEEYRAALDLLPGDPLLLNNVGTVLGALGRDAEAEQMFGTALISRPDDPKILANRALALTRLERLSEALTVLDRILQLDPNDADALTLRAEVFSRLGRLDEALAEVNKALAARPDDARIRELHEAILTEVLRGLVRRGLAGWGGGKPRGSQPPIPITPGPPVSDYVSQDRR